MPSFEDSINKHLSENLETISSDKNTSGNVTYEAQKLVKKMGVTLKRMIEGRVSTIRSKYRNEDFLNSVEVSTETETETIGGIKYVTIAVNFADAVNRKSLYQKRFPKEVFMPSIVNNPWLARGTVHGTDRHGQKITSRPFWGESPSKPHKDLYFIDDIINKFEAETGHKIWFDRDKFKSSKQRRLRYDNGFGGEAF